MRCLKRNMTQFEYYPYSGTESDLNDDGEHTGEYYPLYDDMILYNGNISVPSGRTNQMFYGEDIRYTHTLVMDTPDADINEHGLIRWNDENYDIVAVRPSLNVLSIALRRRTKDNQAEDLDIPHIRQEWPEEPTGETGDEEPIEGETGETGETE